MRLGEVHRKAGVLPSDIRPGRHTSAERTHFHDLINTSAQPDVELDKLFIDVSVYNNRIMGPYHVEAVGALACRTALSYRGVAHITVPTDLQEQDAEEQRSKRNRPHHTSDVFARGARLPAMDDLRRAAEF